MFSATEMSTHLLLKITNENTDVFVMLPCGYGVRNNTITVFVVLTHVFFERASNTELLCFLNTSSEPSV